MGVCLEPFKLRFWTFQSASLEARQAPAAAAAFGIALLRYVLVPSMLSSYQKSLRGL
jgi:hypothetical protein